ncbi:MAG: alpha-glucosidase C-terminal domain-containing protein [Bacteroidales bacterium]|nr:alpha-glucosidase C-terminal domain-containing protein [Bacteroidales bacterium]
MKKFGLLFLISFILLLSGCQEKQQNSKNNRELVSTSEVIHPDWMKDAVMYEVNIRQFSTEGTFNAFATHLPRLKNLGVEILWLMPIHPIGIENRKGELGSYYSVLDYKDVNPEFGTMDDFKAMVKNAHDLEMKVIIDWVPNHSSWDNALLTQHPEWYAKDSTGNMFSPWDWTDVVQFDYSQRGLRDYMIETFKYWLTETDLDGFRMDVAHQVPTDFWNEVRQPLLDVKPDMILLAEAENPELHKQAFDMTYAWEFHHIMNELAQGKKNVSDMLTYFEKHDKEYNNNDIQMYFTSNHDENSWNGTVWERMGDAAEVMAVLSYTVPGMPLIYNGQEAGLAHRLEFFVKDSIPWKEHFFNALYTKLNSFKKDNPALWNPGFGGDMQIINNNKQKNVLSYMRTKGDNEILVIMNLSAEIIDVELDSFDNTETFTCFQTGETVSFAAPSESLSAWEYKIYYR